MRIWVEITGGRYRGQRGWHDGTKDRSAGGRIVVRLPGRVWPRDAVMKMPGDLRALSEVETMAERIKVEAA